MPQAPNVEGLPLWLQAVVTIAFGLATLLIAIKGWKSTEKEESKGGGPPTVAHITDTYAVRNNTDQLRANEQVIASHQKALEENTHYLRIKIDQDREICKRLRQLAEALS